MVSIVEILGGDNNFVWLVGLGDHKIIAKVLQIVSRSRSDVFRPCSASWADSRASAILWRSASFAPSSFSFRLRAWRNSGVPTATALTCRRPSPMRPCLKATLEASRCCAGVMASKDRRSARSTKYSAKPKTSVDAMRKQTNKSQSLFSGPARTFPMRP
jgi:hypothetical protein